LLTRWYSWARRCRLEPMKDFAKTVKTHWDGILNAFDSRLTNGRVEAANAQIQAAKAKARGYGTVRHLITIAYLVAGKLTHLPACPFANKQCAKASA
jgi:transposase